MSFLDFAVKRPDRMAAWRLLRAGSLPENPATFEQRVNSFTSNVLAGRRLSQATLLVVRDDSEITPYVIAEDNAVCEQGLQSLGNATGGVAERMDELPDPFPVLGSEQSGIQSDRVIGRLVARPSMMAGKATVAGADPGELSRILVASMPIGSFVAVTLRRPSRLEGKRVRRWFGHRLQTALPQHYVSDNASVVASFVAGASNTDEVRTLLSTVASTIPGFDIEYRVAMPVPRALPAGLGTATGAGAFAGLDFGLHTPTSAAIGAAAVPVLYGLGCTIGMLPPRQKIRMKDVDACDFPRPRRRILAPAKPRQESTRITRDAQGNQQIRPVRERSGDYPLARDCFIVKPAMIAGLVAPQGGAASGESRTSRVETPAPMRENIGPGLGYSGKVDTLTHIPAWVEEGSTYITGRAGSGKSQLVHSIYGWFCRDRVQPSGVYGSTGAQNSLVVFESSGPDSIKWVRWAEAMGDDVSLIEMTDPASPVIDIFDVPGTSNAERALMLANALIYCFGDDAIGVRQVDTLKGVVEAALAITPEIVNVTDNLKNKVDPAFESSPVYYAHILVGRFGDAMAVELATALAEAAADNPNDAVLRSASEALDPLFGQRTMAQRRDFVDPVRNKIRPMLDSGNWFAPKSGRAHLSWHEILNGHRNIVINMGAASNGTGRLAEESTTTMMLSLLMYTMNREIQRIGAGWVDQGRAVTVFADELSELTAGGESVIIWNRDKGRKYGVRQILATQRTEQLSDALSTCMLDFPNKIFMQQSNAEVIDKIAKQLGGMNPELTPDVIERLERFTAIVKATVGGNIMPAVTVRIPSWSDTMKDYPRVQGWPGVSGGEPTWSGEARRLAEQADGPISSDNLPPLPSDEDAGW